MMRDSHGREISYMRISVTDLCDLRCSYCMPAGTSKLPMSDLMTFEQIERVVSAAVSLGITSFRLTGGEPLVRPGAAQLLAMINATRGVERVAITTNGVQLASRLDELIDAGLKNVNISLDTLDPARFARITGRDAHAQVMSSIRAAVDRGLSVKINCVLLKGVNDDEWPRLAELSRDMPVSVRFIELMPIGHGRESAGVDNDTIRAELSRRYGELEPARVSGSGPAECVRLPGHAGTVGFISAIGRAFCSTCNRIRLTSTGKIKPCLCYGDTIDLMPAAQDGSDEELRTAIERAVLAKPKEHSFAALEHVTETRCMHEIGG